MNEKNNRVVAIVHYNTPELTEALVLSIRKHGGQHYQVIIMDNSDRRPFTKKMDGVKVLDNTKGQLVDFEAELAKFPAKQDHVRRSSNFASTKHSLSVQWLMENLKTDFLLMDSDILLKKPVEHLFQPQYAAVGSIQYKQFNHQFDRERLLPMICYLNAPVLVKNGARYFCPKRTFGLLPNSRSLNNWYDTGAPILEDIRNTKPELVALIYKTLTDLYEHYKHGSWRDNDEQKQKDWLDKFRDLWEPDQQPVASDKVAVCVIGRRENRYAPEFVEHYRRLGVDKIFIYDNNRQGEEHFEDVLQKQIDKGLVEIVDLRDKDSAQNAAYNDCYKQHGSEYQWIGFFDFDEFLVLPKGTKIKKWLQRFDHASAVLVNWQVMTDSNLVTDDGRNCATRFKKPISDTLKRTDNVAFNSHVKSIVRGGMKKMQFVSNPHTPDIPYMTCVNTQGQVVKQSAFTPVCDNIVRLRHYMTKTIEEYVTHKSQRLFPLPSGFNKTWLQTAMENFWNVNGHTPEKDKWLEEYNANRK